MAGATHTSGAVSNQAAIVRRSRRTAGGADQVAGGGAAAIVEEAGRHAGRLTGGAPRRAPAADGDAVAVGQTWGTFLRNHTHDIWACDFLQLYDAWFRPIYAFFIVAHETREVVHVHVTRSPTDAWVAQQLREATPYDSAPRFWIRANDGKFGRDFAASAWIMSCFLGRTTYAACSPNGWDTSPGGDRTRGSGSGSRTSGSGLAA